MIPLSLDFDAQRTLSDLMQDSGIEELSDDPALLAVVRRPARSLTAAQLHLLLQCGVAPHYTVPLSLERLVADPLLQAAESPGDLLIAVLEQAEEFWATRPALYTIGTGVLQAALEAIADLGGDMAQLTGDDFAAAALHFASLKAVVNGH